MALSSCVVSSASQCHCSYVADVVHVQGFRSSSSSSASSSMLFLQGQIRNSPWISCKLEDNIGSKRRGRRGERRDPSLVEEEKFWPFLQTQERMIHDQNKQLLVDTENLLAVANNKFGLVLEIAEEANEYLRHNKDEALTRKPVLKVISDRINEGAGEMIRDAYIEERVDPQE